MEGNANNPRKPRKLRDRRHTTITPNLRKWLVKPRPNVSNSFMCGVANRAGDFATSLIVAWLITRR
ncbi:hypothetical protein ABZ371_22730 [Streptomyces sp. NPDC005899]|uniref:hypothetical protein n=1 Tax=Streptomyces sp. NPDC005899 TaxID=3155716 RepID=UPI0034103D73